MCFALPLKVKTASNKKAIMEDGRQVNLGLVGKAKKNDWLLVKSDLAVEKLSAAEAKSMRIVLKEVSNQLKLS